MFKRLVVSHPLAANMIQTGALFGVGDAIAQYMAPQQPHYDWPRTLRAVGYGGVIFAPIGNKWYHLLAKIKPSASHAVNTGWRVAADQLIFAPFIGIPMYYLVMTVLENRHPILPRIEEQLTTNWWPTLANNWKVWPAFQAVNFFFVPVHLRLLAVNVILIFWNTYLLWTLNAKDAKITQEGLVLSRDVDTADRKTD